LSSQAPTAQTVSIIIPTFNRCEPLQRLLLLLCHQLRPRNVSFDVHVTVDGSTDATRSMLAQLHVSYPLHVHYQSNSGPAAARNRAMSAATGDVFLFADDDVLPVNELVAAHARIHARDAFAVAIGPLTRVPGAHLPPWTEWEALALERHSAALAHGRKPATPHNFYTGNASVRRVHANAVGGFDEDLRRGEDIEFAYRLQERGLHFTYASEAAVAHESDHPLGVWERTPYQYGRNDVAMALQHGRTHALALSFQTPGGQRRMNRLLSHWCIGHSRRTSLAHRMLTGAIQYSGVAAPRGLQRLLCSTLFNLQYWRGVADATGLGSHVWDFRPERYQGWRAAKPAAHDGLAQAARV
jgi:GT2 family glycosyltransferase